MKNKLQLLGLTSICSVAIFLVSAFAQEAETISSAEKEYRDRLIRDAGVAATRAQGRSFTKPATAYPSFNRPSGFALATSPGGGGSWRYFDPNIAKEIVESNTVVDELIAVLKSDKSDEEKTTAKKKIQEELEKQYDFYLKQHEAPLQELEEKLKKLREEFEWRKNARDDLVKLRVDTIWYDSQGLGWPSGQSSPSLLRRGIALPGQNLFTPNLPERAPAVLPTPSTGPSR